MSQRLFSQIVRQVHYWGRSRQPQFKREVIWALIWALLFSLIPWTPPALTPAVEHTFQDAPQTMQWAAPLALSITGWTDEALATLMGPTPVHAGENITLTLSKRDDGPDLGAIGVGPDPVDVSEILVYYIHITNTGTTTATIYLTDDLPSELRCAGAGITSQDGDADWFGGCTGSGSVAFARTQDSIGLGKGLGPGKSAVVYIQAQVQAPLDDGHVFTNALESYYAFATQEPSYTYTGTNDVTTTVRAPRLSITKTATPDPVGAGALLTYTITYSNSGAVNATGIVVTDTVDANVTVLSTVPSSDTMVGRNIVWSSLGDLSPGEQGQITVLVLVSSALSNNSVITNSAEIDCDLDVHSDTGPVETVVKALNVQVSKSVTPTQVRAGEWLTYTIFFTNASDIAIGDVYITDTLPAGFTEVTSDTVGAAFNGQDSNDYGWISTTMQAGNAGVITISAKAMTTSIGSGGMVLSNTVEVTFTQATSSMSDEVPVTVTADEAAVVTIAIVPASTAVGSTADITVTVTDQYGNPVYNGDNYAVNLESEPAGLTFVSTPINVADGQGTATVSTTTMGTYVVTATVAGMSAVSDTAQVTFTTGILDHFVIGSIAEQTAGVDFTIAITAVDQHNNTVTSFNGTVSIEDATTPETLEPDTTSVFVNGVLASQVVSITLARPNTPITVGTGATATTSNLFTVTADDPAWITVTTSQITIPVGSDATVTATVVDTWQNGVPNQVLTFSVSGGTTNPLADMSDANGLVTFYISSTTPGGATVVVTASNGITGSTPVTFIVGCPNTVTVTIVPTSLEVGQSAVITVEVEDAYGNAVNWGSVELAAADLGSGGIAPSTVSLAGGGGTATATISATLVGAKTVVATTVAEAGCTTVSGTGIVTFTVGAVANVTLVMSPDPQQVGVNATLYATATDQYDNPVSGELITFTVTSGGLGSGNIIPETDTTNAQGVATANISSTLVGQTNVTATVASDTTISDTEVASFTGGPPRYITVTVSPTEVESTELATLTVTMADEYGNDCAWQPVTFSVASPYVLGTNTWITPNPATTNDSGVATAVITATDLGTIAITAQGTSIYTGTTVLTITTGPLASFETSDVPDPLGVGITFTLYITAVDAWGNARTKDSGIITITDGTGTVQPAITMMTNSRATVVLSITQTMVDDWIILTWGPDPSVVTRTNSFTVTAGNPSTITLDYKKVISACVAEAIVATVRDAYSNPVPGWVVTFTHSGVGGIEPTTDTSDLDGQATTTISSTVLGSATVQAEVTGVPMVTANITVEVGPPAVMTLISTTNVISAGDSVVFTVTVVDCGGHYVVGETIYVGIISGMGSLDPATEATNTAGQATFVFSGTIAGEVVIGVGDAPPFRVYEEFTVTVEAGPSATITLAANPGAIIPDGVATSTLVATVQDAHGNPVPGQPVNFTRVSGPTDATLSPPSVTTDGAGQATATLTSGATEGVVTVQAECAGITATADVHIRWFIVYLPIAMKKYPTGDLVVSAIQVIPEQGGLYQVRVTIQNLGPETAIGGFWVDLYLDPDGPIALNVLWHHVSRRGKAWYVYEDLAPGEQMVLSTKDPDDPNVPGSRYSNWPGDMGRPGDHELWAMVDCFGDPPTGAVPEVSEQNNIKGPVIYTIPTATGYSYTNESIEPHPTPAP